MSKYKEPKRKERGETSRGLRVKSPFYIFLVGTVVHCMTLHVLNSACSGFQTNRPSSCCWPPCGLRGHIRDRVKPRARKKVDSSTSCAIYVAVDIILLLLLGSFFRIRAILSLLLFLIKNMYISFRQKKGFIYKSNHLILPLILKFSE